MGDRIHKDDTGYAEAFNAGSDARLRCDPLDSNPYPSNDESRYQGWRAGWRDVAQHWCDWARPSVRVPLPAVRGVPVKG